MIDETEITTDEVYRKVTEYTEFLNEKFSVMAERKRGLEYLTENECLTEEVLSRSLGITPVRTKHILEKLIEDCNEIARFRLPVERRDELRNVYINISEASPLTTKIAYYFSVTYPSTEFADEISRQRISMMENVALQ